MGTPFFLIFLKRLTKSLGLFLFLFVRDDIKTEEGNIPMTGPMRLRIFLEEMGGAFVKFGQMIDLYQDIFPYEYTKEVLKMKNKSPEAPFYEMKNIFLEETGIRAENFFADLNPKPVAVTSSSQIYRAKLKNGQPVAVKIQRPGARIFFEADFMVISLILNVSIIFGLLPAGRTQEMLYAFVSWARKSLDFLLEAKNAEIQYHHSAAHPNTIIPDQYLEISTHKILIHDFIEGGVSVSEYFWSGERKENQEENREEHKNIMEYIIADELRQYFIDGFFHADPHPGNLYFLPDNKLVHLDFWIIGNAEKRNEALLKTIYAIHKRDTEGFIKNFFDIGDDLLDKDIESYMRRDLKKRNQLEKLFEKIKLLIFNDFRAKAVPVVSKWFDVIDDKNISVGERRSAPFMFELIKISQDYNLKFSRDTLLFLRALSALDIIGLQAAKEFNLPQAIGRFFAEYPIDIAGAMIREGIHCEESGEKIIPLTDISWEFFRENAYLEKEKMYTAREKIDDIIIHYGDKYEEIRSMLKTLK